MIITGEEKAKNELKSTQKADKYRVVRFLKDFVIPNH
jgi:hypothetical protein